MTRQWFKNHYTSKTAVFKAENPLGCIGSFYDLRYPRIVLAHQEGENRARHCEDRPGDHGTRRRDPPTSKTKTCRSPADAYHVRILQKSEPVIIVGLHPRPFLCRSLFVYRGGLLGRNRCWVLSPDLPQVLPRKLHLQSSPTEKDRAPNKTNPVIRMGSTLPRSSRAPRTTLVPSPRFLCGDF